MANISTPMFDKLLETKKDREICEAFLEFLKKQGLIAEADEESLIAEFFGIDLEQAEEERKALIKNFGIIAKDNSHTASEALARVNRERKKETNETDKNTCEPKKEEVKEDIKTNSHGVNAKIKGHILPESQMREIGFTDYAKDRWYFCRMIQFPKKKYRGLEISFSVTIPKDGSDIRIDVLDEDFCQPYDYQHFLSKNPQHKISNIIKEQVEDWMEMLQEKGVLEGHVRGEYI